MLGYDNAQSITNMEVLSREGRILSSLIEAFNGVRQCELDQVSFDAFDRMLGLGTSDAFYCEVTCLGYAAHALAASNGPSEVWIIPPANSSVDTLTSETNADGAIDPEWIAASLRRTEESCPQFKGFTSTPPNNPFKLLITTQACEEVGIPDALAWPEIESPFYRQLWEHEDSRGAIVFPPLADQPESLSLREGVQSCSRLGWAIELPSGHIAIGHGPDSKTCRMIDLSDCREPWEMDVSPFVVSACGGCLVPSICRRFIADLEQTTLGELAARISRGTSLSRKELNPRSSAEAHRGKPLLRRSESGLPEIPDNWIRDARHGFLVDKQDFLFLDSGCINADEISPLCLEEIPKGQERYTVEPHDGEVLLISRNEKRVVLYKAVRPTLIANSVYIVWLGPRIKGPYLVCWLESDFARQWLKGAFETLLPETSAKSSESILTKKTLASLPVPVFGEDASSRIIDRRLGIQREIRKLHSRIAALEAKSAFVPSPPIPSSNEKDS